MFSAESCTQGFSLNTEPQMITSVAELMLTSERQENCAILLFIFLIFFFSLLSVGVCVCVGGALFCFFLR